ncbi:diguanylate cyclase [Orenia marismortui]|uniref:diguanylate cyclase n=1 Tax=Orenia marismortui TaxID=46469 RepID=UPI00037F9010|nr:diguanylate cyclase [Orenia marismortui]
MKFKKILTLVLIILSLLLYTTTIIAYEDVDKVNLLIIHSYHQGFSWTDKIDNGLKEYLAQDSREIDIHTEYLDTKLVADEKHLNNIYNLFQYKFKNSNFDLILASDDNALEFLFKYKKNLFPNIPVVFCGINNFSIEKLNKQDMYTGLIENIDILSTIKVALKLHPDFKNIIGVFDNTTTGKYNKQLFKKSITFLSNDINVLIYSIDGMDDLGDISDSFPEKSIMFLGSTMLKDRSGNLIPNQRVITLLTQDIDLPIYSFWDFFLGYGIVGGKLSSGYYQGKSAAKMSLEVIDGKRPEIKESSNIFMFDYKQLKKLGVSLNNLPEDSIVINKPFSFYTEYKTLVWLTVSWIIIMGLIIFILIVNIIKRKSVEIKLKDSESKYRILFKNNGAATCIVDKDRTISLVNKELENLTGYSKEEIEAKMSWEDFIYDQESLDKILEQHYQKREENNSSPYKYEINIVDKEGKIKTVLLQSKLIPGTERSIVSLLDITKRKAAEEKIKYINYHDDLTGLYNRKFYEEELKRLDTQRKMPLSIIIGDANGLKLTNDIFGHEMGDQLLQEMARLLKKSAREEDIISRWGGDEFGIILPNTDREDVARIIKRIKDNLANSDFGPIKPHIALGSATKFKVSQDIEEIFSQAEDQMYKDKSNSKDSLDNPLLKSLLEELENENYEIEGHRDRTIRLSRQIGKKLDLTDREIERLTLLAKYHDVGKLAIKKEIINKDSPLEQKELEEFKQHPEIGYNIAKSFQALRIIADDILYHHENWDGSGYPEGLDGEDIPLLSRIMHVVDTYDALTHREYYILSNNKTYYGPLSQVEALEIIEDNAGKIFDSKIVTILFEVVKS